MVTFFDFSVVEKISGDAVRQNFLSLKVDHMKGVVLYGENNLLNNGGRVSWPWI
ncbi:unnamed protein product [Rhodiola kirilowii]